MTVLISGRNFVHMRRRLASFDTLRPVSRYFNPNTLIRALQMHANSVWFGNLWSVAHEKGLANLVGKLKISYPAYVFAHFNGYYS